MKFKNFHYDWAECEALSAQLNKLLDNFSVSDSFEAQNKIIEAINRVRTKIESMAEIVYIRHTMDTSDEFYDKEWDFIDETAPGYKGALSRYYKMLIKSKYRPQLEEKWGKQIFNIAEVKLKTFSEEIVEDLKYEYRLISEYSRLIASAKINFEDKEYNLSGMMPFMQSTDRNIRKKAAEARYNFFKSNENEFDRIFDEMVRVRTTIARKLGYENFVQLGYDRMMRTDYNPDMIAGFRKQIAEYIVPIASKLRERQRVRLGLEELRYFDEELEFTSGNAVPKGNYEWIIANARRMYSELSPETAEFFNFMVENELMVLTTRKGKSPGGYSHYLGEYKSPFIFSNFNGTSNDINVLVHESGHAFQAYTSSHFSMPEYIFPTEEASEIHSMAMELFAYPWLELFFKEDADKYRFTHLNGALLFLPYGTAVDEYQHYIYENPDLSPEERKSSWRKIEKKYLPHRDYADNEFLERGTYWYQQRHIFNSPFYYIDYVLAQTCAFQFWKKSKEDKKTAWEDFLRLCRHGGSASFLELVDAAGLISPFKEGCIKSITAAINDFLACIDDTTL